MCIRDSRFRHVDWTFLGRKIQSGGLATQGADWTFPGRKVQSRVITLGAAVLLLALFASVSYTHLDVYKRQAVTIGTSMADKAPVVGASTKLLLLGAPSIGAGGLLRFYLLHVLFVPLAIIFVFFIHYYKVVRVGISLPSSEEEVGQDTAKRVPADKRRYYLPDVFTDEMVFLGLITFILLALILFGIYPGAPLEHHANANQTPLHTEAPWYFLWIQGCLLYTSRCV